MFFLKYSLPVLSLLLLPLSLQAATPNFDEVGKAVKAGEFQKITSIIVSRDGKVLYEEYFDEGGAEARRNTRSSTKTVAGILTGLAIADGKLPNQQVSILPYLSAKHPVIQNDDPRKAKITGCRSAVFAKSENRGVS